MMGYIVLIIFIALFIFVVIKTNEKPSEEKLQQQKENYEKLLVKYNVPENHYKIVIGQSKVHNVYNCPALIWKEEDKVKLLILSLNPILTEVEEEDFLFLASQPYVDFIRFDGTEYPDWAVQSAAVKEMFLPYVDLSRSSGGIDYKRQMYWAGIICVYPTSMAEIFKMMGRPLSDYENRVDNKKLMFTDGSLPEEMMEEYKKSKEAREEAATFLKEEDRKEESLQGMEQALQVIRDTERKAGEDVMNSLYARLLQDKRFEDLEKATKDEEYRKALLKEYDLG